MGPLNRSVVPIAWLLTTAFVGLSRPAGASSCAFRKLKAVGNEAAALLRCQSNVAATNDASGLASCEMDASDRFASTFNKIPIPNGPPAPWCGGDLMSCESRADGCEAAVSAAMSDTFPSPCEAAKRKAAGELVRRELNCYARAANRGSALDPACISKATAGFAAALMAAGACPDGGSPQVLVEDNCVTPLVTTDSGGAVNTVCGGCGVLRTAWGAAGHGTGTFNNIRGVAANGGGNVYVADASNDRIHKFTSEGTFITMWGSAGNGDGQFNKPQGVAVDSGGNVYAVDQDNNRIQKFDSAGTFLAKWGGTGSGNGQFNGPTGVTVDMSGNVYVADAGNNRIQKFTSDGTFITTWGSTGSGDGQFKNFGGFLGVAADGSGNVYTADGGNHRIQKFTSDGTFVTQWGSTGSGDGQFNIGPFVVAVDGSGNVYVADGRIQKFASDGTFLDAWKTNNGTPFGMDVDGSGSIYLALLEFGASVRDRVEKFASCP